jgi:sugar lactone lactonase YvrE
VAFSPDGKILASAGAECIIRLWDPVKGKYLHGLRGHKDEVASIAFSPGGRFLASGCLDDTIRLWEVIPGKERRRFQGHQPGSRFILGIDAVTFSPDGKTLAALDWDSIRFFRVATGMVTHQIENPQASYCLVFSPDGKTLAAGGRELTFWKVATGKERFTLAGDFAEAYAAAFSPDGKTLAVGDRVTDTVYLYEVASGQERRRFRGHSAGVQSVAFSPDGKTLASGSQDATILIWDVTGHLQKGRLPADRLSPKDLGRLWSELAANDARKAFRALWTMVRAPRQTVPFLERHLQAVSFTRAGKRRLARLIADLGNEAVAVQENAVKELSELGALAGPALRKALAGHPSAEVRERAGELLRKLDGPLEAPDKLRPLRAIEILEHIGTPKARRVLKRLAEGVPEARVTQGAKAASERLARRSLSR